MPESKSIKEVILTIKYSGQLKEFSENSIVTNIENLHAQEDVEWLMRKLGKCTLLKWEPINIPYIRGNAEKLSVIEFPKVLVNSLVAISPTLKQTVVRFHTYNLIKPPSYFKAPKFEDIVFRLSYTPSNVYEVVDESSFSTQEIEQRENSVILSNVSINGQSTRFRHPFPVVENRFFTYSMHAAGLL